MARKSVNPNDREKSQRVEAKQMRRAVIEIPERREHRQVLREQTGIESRKPRKDA